MTSISPRISFSGGTLLLEGMPRERVLQTFGSHRWVWDGRVGAWRADAIEYAAAAAARLGGDPPREVLRDAISG